jgi:hypothetical protein
VCVCVFVCVCGVRVKGGSIALYGEDVWMGWVEYDKRSACQEDPCQSLWQPCTSSPAAKKGWKELMHGVKANQWPF